MKALILTCSLVIVLGQTIDPAKADRRMLEAVIWHACWSSRPFAARRQIRYPQPIFLRIRNHGPRELYLCVYDNRCPYTLFKGGLSPNFSITLTACADERHRGSISIMSSEGTIWSYRDTGDRIVTFE